MNTTNQFDIIIIGAGPGGYTAAIRARQCGLSTALIEKDATMGGTCLNIGCIPSKALLDSSEHFAFAQSGLVHHGIVVDSVKLDLASMMARKDSVVNTLTRNVKTLLTQNGVTIIHGTAHFTSANELAVENNGQTTSYNATRGIIIATGSTPVSLPSIPFDYKRIVDSTGALSFQEVPEHLAVIGGGAIGVELASVWARLGSKVTILELMPQLLPGWDGQSARLLQRLLKAQGIDILTSTSVTKFNFQNEKIQLSIQGKTGDADIIASHVLIAVGRKPNTAKLALNTIGIMPDPINGRLSVDKSYMTSCKNVYAIGDIVYGPMLAHKASSEGVAVIDRLVGIASSVNYTAIPGVVYSSPEVATIGFTDTTLTANGTDFKTGISYFKGNGRAIASHTTDGFVKILSDAKTDRILGVQIVGEKASELIAQAVIGMEFGTTSEDIGLMSFSHPTLSEAMKEASLDVAKVSINGLPIILGKA